MCIFWHYNIKHHNMHKENSVYILTQVNNRLMRQSNASSHKYVISLNPWAQTHNNVGKLSRTENRKIVLWNNIFLGFLGGKTISHDVKCIYFEDYRSLLDFWSICGENTAFLLYSVYATCKWKVLRKYLMFQKRLLVYSLQ